MHNKKKTYMVLIDTSKKKKNKGDNHNNINVSI